MWKEVIVPTTGSEPVSDVLFHQRIPLRQLEPATAYDVKIQARNAHGWNAVSDQFRFATLTRGEGGYRRHVTRGRDDHTGRSSGGT